MSAELREKHTQRTEALSRAQASLDVAERERVATVRGYADDPSQDNLTAHQQADARVSRARLDVEAAKLREGDARAELTAAERRGKMADVEKYKAAADVARLMTRAGPLLQRFLEADRALAATVEELRALAGHQREAFAAASKAARTADLDPRIALAEVFDVHLDDLRAVAGIMTHRDRASAGRQKQVVDAFLSPVAEPAPNADEAETADYERASALVAMLTEGANDAAA